MADYNHVRNDARLLEGAQDEVDGVGREDDEDYLE